MSAKTKQQREEAKRLKLERKKDKKAERLAAKEEKKEKKEEKKRIKKDAAGLGIPLVLVQLNSAARNHVKQAMKDLLKPHSVKLSTLQRRFGYLEEEGLARDSLFSRKTGEPKLKRALNKQGREVLYHFFPEQKKDFNMKEIGGESRFE